MTQQGIHDLLDRVLDGGGSDEFEFGMYGAIKRVALKVCVGKHYYRESLPITELPNAVRRAKEATDE